jgi:hypothetical protein
MMSDKDIVDLEKKLEACEKFIVNALNETAERTLSSGPLSGKSTYRLIVSGPLGSREIDALIKMLEVCRDVFSTDRDDL